LNWSQKDANDPQYYHYSNRHHGQNNEFLTRKVEESRRIAVRRVEMAIVAVVEIFDRAGTNLNRETVFSSFVQSKLQFNELFSSFYILGTVTVFPYNLYLKFSPQHFNIRTSGCCTFPRLLYPGSWKRQKQLI